jgi:ABC-type sulfate transport system substrate-binding protein
MNKHAQIICNIDKIGEIQEVKKLKGKSIYKKALIVSFEDGRTMYPEVRNKFITIFDEHNLEEGETVILDLMFEGSEKKGIRYNNINIVGVKRL